MRTALQAKDIKGSTDYFALNHYTSLCASALPPHAQHVSGARTGPDGPPALIPTLHKKI